MDKKDIDRFIDMNDEDLRHELEEVNREIEELHARDEILALKYSFVSSLVDVIVRVITMYFIQ
jgi:hypothetical protein